MEDWDSGPVLRRLDDGVLVVTLNRPDHGNAWSADLADKYFDTLEEAGEDSMARVIVVTGAGRSFCVGADVGGITGDHTPARPRPMTFASTISKPIIAAINGGCAGIGLVQALMCDIRIATPRAKITTAFRAAWPGRRARHRMAASASHRCGEGARSAAVRACRHGGGSSRAWAHQRDPTTIPWPPRRRTDSTSRRGVRPLRCRSSRGRCTGNSISTCPRPCESRTA